MNATIRIRAVGDVGVVGRAADGVRRNGSSWLFDSVRSELTDADLFLLNVEMPFAPAGTPHPAHIPAAFRAEPEHSSALHCDVRTIACVANNHAMDFGAVGLRTTLDRLRRHSIDPVGAGDDLLTARAPVVVEIGTTRLGVLAYAAEGPHSATDGAGCAIAREEEMLADVTSLRQRADIVIVHLHGGSTYVDLPSPDDRALRHALIRAGAHVVLGHHPHVWQGVERVDGGLVAHSLGEFVFDSRIGNVVAVHAEDRRRRTGILEVDLDPAARRVVGWKVLPCRIDADGRPVPSSHVAEDLERLAGLDALLAEGDYDARFRREAGRNLVGHETRVMLSAARRLDVGYFWQKLTRIRLRHLRLLTIDLLRRAGFRPRAKGTRRDG